MTTHSERETFKSRLAGLSTQPEILDAVFAETVYDAMTRFGIGEESFRDVFGLTGGAVMRWTTGQNLPQMSVRRKIIAWVADQL